MECTVVRPYGAAAAFGGQRRRVVPVRSAMERQLVAPLRCSKMYVPGFGEGSPEKKAAINLQHFFNYLAVRIVLAQLQVAFSVSVLLVAVYFQRSIRFLRQSYNQEAYYELKEFVDRTSLNDADVFCKKLIRESPRLKGLAMRILEVRSAYVKSDFEWENLKKLSFKMVDEANTKLMREYVLEVSHIEDK